MPKSSRTLDISARIAVAVIISVGPALVTVGLLTNQLILIAPGATTVAGPFLLFRQLRKAGLDHPRPIIAGLLCLIGVLFLGYLTPLFGSIFVSQPTIT